MNSMTTSQQIITPTDKNLVDGVKDMLNGCYRVNIQNGLTLIEVVNLFDNPWLLDQNEVIHHNFRKTSKYQRHHANFKNFRRNQNDKNFNPPQSNNFKQNSGHFSNNYRHPGTNNRIFGQNSG